MTPRASPQSDTPAESPPDPHPRPPTGVIASALHAAHSALTPTPAPDGLTDLTDDGFPEMPPSVLADPRPTPTHCGITLASLYGWLLPCLLPCIAAGALLFGWRAIVATSITVVSTLAAVALWRLVSQRGRSMHYAHALYLSVLLACLLPPDLARLGAKGWTDFQTAGWPLLVASGFTLATAYWLFGGVGARLHPVAASVLILLAIFPTQMSPSHVLCRPHLFFGDLLISRPAFIESVVDPHLSVSYPPDSIPAIRTEPASSKLTAYLHGSTAPDGNWVSLDTLLRDRLPPLEDLILGGHPASIGLGSLAAVLFAGLVLLFRGGADWRVPLLTLLTATLAFCLLPIPIVVTPAGTVTRWLAFRESGVTWETLLTFACYQVAAGPLVFTAFFLATTGAGSPTSRPGRLLYAALLGLASAAAQLLWTVSTGPLAALLILSLFSPLLDRLLKPKPLL